MQRLDQGTVGTGSREEQGLAVASRGTRAARNRTRTINNGDRPKRVDSRRRSPPKSTTTKSPVAPETNVTRYSLESEKLKQQRVKSDHHGRSKIRVSGSSSPRLRDHSGVPGVRNRRVNSCTHLPDI